MKSHRNELVALSLGLGVSLLLLSSIVISARGEPLQTSDFTPTAYTYLPFVAREPTDTPTPPPLVIADFDRCDNINNLGGEMGAAYTGGDLLFESYPPRLSDGGCMVRLEYHIEVWSAFWLELRMLDLSPRRQISFDIRADEPVPGWIKVELHRACTTVDGNTTCEQSEITYFSGITTTWQTMSIPLSDFGPAPGFDPLETWEGIQELVFTFEHYIAGQYGVVYLDNIEVWE